ncbi:MAG: hypothetical protein R2757_10180, partial [Draconibacterium sp.]
MKLTIYFVMAVFTFSIVSCGPSDENKARVKLTLAKNLLEKQDTTLALLQLDSISKLYPEAVYSINAAKNM